MSLRDVFLQTYLIHLIVVQHHLQGCWFKFGTTFFYKTFVLKSNIDHFLYLRVRRKPLRETNRVDSVVHEVRIFWSLWCCQQHFYCIKIFALWNELRINKKKCKVFEIKGRKDVEEKMFLRKKATNPSRIPKLFSHF